MSALAVEAPVTIRLELGCDGTPACAPFAERHLQQLERYTARCSLLELSDWGGWLAGHRTSRRGRARAMLRGYTFAEFDRADHVDEIYMVNTSAEHRQGRRMDDEYWLRPEYGPLGVQCPRHAINCYGVFGPDGGALVAYAFVYRLGELALISQILGILDPADHGFMYMLMSGIVESESPHGGWLFYNRHDSGGPGLMFKKERYGFRAGDITWAAA